MYQSLYEEVANGSGQVERENEILAFDHAIHLLELAERSGPGSKDAVDAQFYLHRLWVFFIEDLTKEDNLLSEQLKADIISVGIWVLREIERLRQGESKSFGDLISVMTFMKDGLQ